MKVGDTIYKFNVNRRRYAIDEDGKAKGGPIWIEHWEPIEIIGETKVSWLVGFKHKPDKINKKKLEYGELTAYATTWEEVKQQAWVNSNKYKIARLVEREDDIHKLKEIAKILNYSEESHK